MSPPTEPWVCEHRAPEIAVFVRLRRLMGTQFPIKSETIMPKELFNPDYITGWCLGNEACFAFSKPTVEAPPSFVAYNVPLGTLLPGAPADTNLTGWSVSVSDGTYCV